MNFKSLEGHLELVHGKDYKHRKEKTSSEDTNNSKVHSDDSTAFQE